MIFLLYSSLPGLRLIPHLLGLHLQLSDDCLLSLNALILILILALDDLVFLCCQFDRGLEANLVPLQLEQLLFQVKPVLFRLFQTLLQLLAFNIGCWLRWLLWLLLAVHLLLLNLQGLEGFELSL